MQTAREVAFEQDQSKPPNGIWPISVKPDMHHVGRLEVNLRSRLGNRMYTMNVYSYVTERNDKARRTVLIYGPTIIYGFASV